MKLASAPKDYDQVDQASVRREMQQADRLNMKTNVALTFVLLQRPDGTVGKLTVDNTNTLHFAPL